MLSSPLLYFLIIDKVSDACIYAAMRLAILKWEKKIKKDLSTKKIKSLNTCLSNQITPSSLLSLNPKIRNIIRDSRINNVFILELPWKQGCLLLWKNGSLLFKCVKTLNIHKNLIRVIHYFDCSGQRFCVVQGNTNTRFGYCLTKVFTRVLCVQNDLRSTVAVVGQI